VTTKQEFLARVADRLGRSRPATEAPGWKPSTPLPTFGLTEVEALVERYRTEMDKLSGKTYRVSSLEEVAPKVLEILAASGLQGSVVRWEDPALDGLDLDKQLEGAGYEVVPFKPCHNGRTLVEQAEAAVAGITGVDAAIAETGTLVMGSSRLGEANAPGRGRTVSLLPPLHIAVLRKEHIVYSALQIFQRLAGISMPSQVVFASGPSRSADIENDLSIGVHGPKQVHVIIV